MLRASTSTSRLYSRLGARFGAHVRCCSGGSSSSSDAPPPAPDSAASDVEPPLPPPSLGGSVLPEMLSTVDPLPKRILKQAARAKVDAYELQHLNSMLGFSSRRTHPSSYNYLLGVSGGQMIIDPEETLVSIRRSLAFLKAVSFRGGRTLFVSTQPTLARLCRVVGEQSGEFYLAKRWVPGLLTNWDASRQHIHSKMHHDPRMAAAGQLKFSDLQKANHFRGVEHMTRPPDVIFRLDRTPLYGEPVQLNVPLISVVDTDTPTTDVQYPIPANTKSLRFYHTLSHLIVRAINDGKALRKELDSYGVAEGKSEKEERSGQQSGQQRRGRGGGQQRGGRGGGGRPQRGRS